MLTREDIEVLMEAVEAWEVKDAAGEMMGDLMVGLLSRRNPDEKDAFEKDMLRQKTERADKQRIRKERGVILRAKLIEIRDAMSIDKVLPW